MRFSIYCYKLISFEAIFGRNKIGFSAGLNLAWFRYNGGFMPTGNLYCLSEQSDLILKIIKLIPLLPYYKPKF